MFEKSIYESENYVYGYCHSIKGFIPYDQKDCKKIDCIYCKKTQKMYGI